MEFSLLYEIDLKMFSTLRVENVENVNVINTSEQLLDDDFPFLVFVMWSRTVRLVQRFSLLLFHPNLSYLSVTFLYTVKIHR